MKLVIVGNGMATDAVLDAWIPRAASLKISCEITVFGDEPGAAYNRILLVDLLTGRKSEETLRLKTPDWYTSHGITIRSGVRIARIDPRQKVVFDAEGNPTGYDRLLLAVGSRPFLPPVPGISLEGVHVLRTLGDARNLADKVREGGQAVVLGGGLLGLEAARGLSDLGMRVRVLHLKDRVMEQQLDDTGGALLKKELERQGIEIRLNAVLARICGEGIAQSVLLEGGGRIPADLVLISAGVVPDTGLAASCGIPVGRGILVDDHLQTGIPEIFAVGDAIEHRNTCYGLVAPLREQAQVAVHNMTVAEGESPIDFGGKRCAATLKVSGIALTSAGDILGREEDEQCVFLDSRRGVFRKFVFRGDALVGAILLGESQGTPEVLRLIESGEPSGVLKDALFGISAPSDPRSPDDKDLVCLCHSVTRGTIVAAIKSNGLKTREEVALHTRASTGCGSCSQTVTDLVTLAQPLAPTPAPVPSDPETPVVRTLLSDYPPVYPKALEIDRIKKEGLGLDFEEIFSKGITAMSEDDFYRLKTYGICSQKHPGFFMVRIRIPGGRMTPEQALAVAKLSEQYGGGWAHLSTRQNVELHWVTLKDVPLIWETLDAVGLSTRSSCGHTLRNIMACPHGAVSPEARGDVLPIARRVSDYFVQRSDLINPGLPNRLNIVFSACPECDPDVWINDIGFRAVSGPGGKADFGFEFWAGGSLGAHPVLGFRLSDFLSPSDVLPACQAIIEIYTKHGNRNKARSRLKWLVEQWGKEKFAGEFEKVFRTKRFMPENAGFTGPITSGGTEDPQPCVRPSLPDGCFRQKQPGKVRIPVQVPLGEIRSRAFSSLAEMLRDGRHGILQMTKEQRLEIQDVPVDQAPKILESFKKWGLTPLGFNPSQNIIACPGTEFCVLAVTDSQGVGRALLRNFEKNSPEEADLLNNINIAVSGCPNSCAKHQIADIGFSGAMTTVGEDRRYAYSLYLGGSMEGTAQLGEVVLRGLTEEMLIPVFHTLLECVGNDRKNGETFRKVVERVGAKSIGNKLEDRLKTCRPRIWEKILMECQFEQMAGTGAALSRTGTAGEKGDNP